MKKAILINNLLRNKPIRELTLGKEYEIVMVAVNGNYIIINDFGDKHSLDKSRFL